MASLRPARIMMYSQDSYGLGHLRRATNLANSLVTQHPNLSVLLVVDSPVAPFFELGHHIDFLKLPTVIKVGAGVFRTSQLLTGYPMVRAMRSNVIREVLRRFRPDVVLVDHMPGGANRDLVPALNLIRPLGYATKVVLGVRDIIDNPIVTRSVWQRERFYDTLKRYYDRVLIYGSADVFPTAEHYGIRDAIGADRVHYCGYVCNMDTAKDPRHIRTKIRVHNGHPLVAVMAGGGADAYQLMQAYMNALPLVNCAVGVSTLMVTGPFMPEEQRKALRVQAKAKNVTIHSSIGDSLSHINAADLVVSMAGYNTLTEILRFRKRAVIVPRPGPSAEQCMRASILGARGLVTAVDPRDLSAERLAQAIIQTLARPQPSGDALPDLCGITKATSALLSLLPSGNGRVVRARRPVAPVMRPVWTPVGNMQS